MPACTGKPPATDLRERVRSSVLRKGPSRNQAAAQFEVAVSTVVKWVRRYQDTGSLSPARWVATSRGRSTARMRSGFLARLRERASTLTGLLAELAERGLKVDNHSVWISCVAQGSHTKKTLPVLASACPERCLSATGTP